MADWVIYVLAAALLLIAGFIAVVRRRRASFHVSLDSALAEARRAVALAEASRDSALRTSAAADAALAESQGLLASAPDVSTARHARDLAERADALWRADSPSRGDAQ